MNKINLHKNCKIEFETPNGQSFKFGYYNYNPISSDGTKLLAHKINFEGRAPNELDIVEIGFFDLKNNNWVSLTTSKTFNWQQGAMLQWLGPDFNSRIIFNDFENGNYISRILDVHTLKEKKIAKAIYAVHPSGEYSISLNFERCNFTRAYSYAQKIDLFWENLPIENDGILKIDLINNTYTEILSLKDIIYHENQPDINKKHWLEHLMFNKTGTRFAFYHRFETEKGYYTRCLTADVYGENVWALPLKDTEMISHLGWQDDKNFVIFTRPQSKMQALWVGKPKQKVKDNNLRMFYRKFLKKLIPSFVKKNVVQNAVAYYMVVSDMNNRIGKIEVQPKGMDGHPTFSDSSRFMLTDTYADSNNYRHLMIYDTSNNKTIGIGSFFSHYNNCNWRADLHPRFNTNENKIIIDVNMEGYTKIMIINIEKFRLNNA